MFRNASLILGLSLVGLSVGCRGDRPKPRPKPSKTSPGPAAREPTGGTAKRGPARGLREPCPPAPPLARPTWPSGFQVRGSVRVPPDELARFATRLGGRLASLTHHLLAPPQGPDVRVNVVEAKSAPEARAMAARLGHRPGLAGHLLTASRFLVEIVGATPLDQHRLAEALGLLDRTTRRYRLRLRMALVDGGDAGAINRAYNLLLDPRPQDAGWTRALAQELGQVRFGKELTLRRAATAAGGAPRYAFTPEPRSSRQTPVATRYTFEKAPRLHGIPYVDLEAEVWTAGYRALPDRAPDDRLTAPSEAWPTRHGRIQAILDRVVPPGSSPRARLVVLHEWVHRRIPQGGPQLGARQGTLATLDKRHGRCWERSDVLVTLLRAAGIPTRQVTGWVDGLGGHIWAETYLPGEGWIGVDATAPWIGVAGEYVPLLLTEDGAMSVFHLTVPRIEREGCREEE